ncbi:hypothetical protein [Pediococcus pentosaceus]|uniref:glycoside hydrolase family 38 N-terminal domain-containing protein n=1 Tax=Pediococcus pentosaceus TaxID=1255 RepID=UPI002F26779E
MCIGYLPDTFGFNAQMPVILQEAGLDNIVMWRGLNLNKHVKSPYFKWAGMAIKIQFMLLICHKDMEQGCCLKILSIL